MASSGNFAVFNHLKYKASSYTASNIDAAGLQLGSTTGNAAQLNVGFKLGDGKFYYEVYGNTVPSSLHFGVCIGNADLNNVTAGKAIIGYRDSGNKLVSTAPQTNSTQSSYGASFTGGDIMGCAVDFTNGTIEFYKNNASQGQFSWSSANDGETYYPYVYQNTGIATINTGQDSTFCGNETAQGNTDENGFGDFYYTPPSGFLAMCSANMPTSSDIDPGGDDGADENPTKQFNVVTYTGNGSTQSITGLGFQPDMVWIKSRSSSEDPSIYDSTRGVTKRLKTSTTGAPSTVSNGFTAFDSDGFSLGSATENNGSSQTYVAWCWKAGGGTTSSNSNGASTTTVQANTKAGFSIVEFPNYTPNSTFGHGLNSAPEFIIAVLLSGSQRAIYHTGLSSSSYLLYLNQTASEATSTIFNSTAPTSSVFSLGSSFAGSGTGVAFCWHGVSGFSKFGRYIGNGNTDGPFIFTGFRPRMLFLRRIDGSGSYLVSDSARRPNNDGTHRELYWNSNSSEATGADSHDGVDYHSNGFKLKGSNAGCNGNGNEYIYGAWGDLPAKYNNGF